MKPIVGLFAAALISGCGSQKQAETTSCEAVAKRFVEIDAGDKASFLTDRERASRARRWLATCEPMSEAARTCVLASTTMAQAGACSNAGSAGPAPTDASAKAAWVLHGGDASAQDAQFVALDADGDLVVTGDLDGTLELGGESVTADAADAWVARLSPTGTVRWLRRVGGAGIESVKALDVGADGSVALAMLSDREPRVSRIALAADGTIKATPIATDRPVDSAALHADGDLVVSTRAFDPASGGTCAARGFVVQRFAADGKRLWSRCNDANEQVSLTSERMRIAAGPDGMTAACGGFSGALAWGGKAAPDSDADGERAFVVAFDRKGKQLWVQYVTSESRAACEALAIADDGSVVAIVRGSALGSALAVWESDGSQRMRSCGDLLGVNDECALSAVTTSGTAIIVAGQAVRRTVIATIDGKTGATTQATSFGEGSRISGLAVRAGAFVFATGFSDTVNFGTGPVTSTAGSGRASMDVLIGRL